MRLGTNILKMAAYPKWRPTQIHINVVYEIHKGNKPNAHLFSQSILLTMMASTFMPPSITFLESDTFCNVKFSFLKDFPLNTYVTRVRATDVDRKGHSELIYNIEGWSKVVFLFCL